MKILICDDERDILYNTRNRVEKILKNFFPQEDNAVFACENTFVLYDYLEKNNFIADGIFMDINLKSNNGIEVAGKIKEIKDNIRIIFFTGNIEYAESIFKVAPFDFAVKPVSEERLSEILIRLKENIDKDKEEIITIKSIKGIYRILPNEISYVESNGRYVYIHTSKEKIITINKMDKVLEILGQGFVRCHKSYIVNGNKIRKYAAGRVVLFDETEIFVSKKYRQEIKTAILNSI